MGNDTALLRDRIHNLSYDRKVALIARAADRERRAREARIATADVGTIINIPVPNGTPLTFFLSEDDLAL